MKNLDVVIRRSSFPFCGRLFVMDNINRKKLSDPSDLTGEFSIDFPAMPDMVELARQAEYRVLTNPVAPDGVHQYKGTTPMAIPFSFALTALDSEYCINGSLTLLQIAARLHAFILPFGDSDSMTIEVQSMAALAQNKPVKGAKSPQQEAVLSQASVESGGPAFWASENAKFDPPATCRLELMYTRESEPGIVCTGYLKEVSAKLKGPWLRGPGGAYNLPTSGEFSFTFMHVPGHYNKLGSLGSVNMRNAYASYVLERLYNTRALTGEGNYTGFREDQSITSSPTVVPVNKGSQGAQERRNSVLPSNIRGIPITPTIVPGRQNFVTFPFRDT